MASRQSLWRRTRRIIEDMRAESVNEEEHLRMDGVDNTHDDEAQMRTSHDSDLENEFNLNWREEEVDSNCDEETGFDNDEEDEFHDRLENGLIG